MRLLSGAAVTEGDGRGRDRFRRRRMVAQIDGRAMAGARHCKGVAQIRRRPESDPGPALRGTLRPYQKARRAEWMRLLTGLGTGRVPGRRHGAGQDHPDAIALLLVQGPAKFRREAARRCLLVAPASLLANWAGGDQRASRPACGRTDPASLGDGRRRDRSSFRRLKTWPRRSILVITTYGSVAAAAGRWRTGRLEPGRSWTRRRRSRIRPPSRTKCRQGAEGSRRRIALTGTPVENQPGRPVVDLRLHQSQDCWAARKQFSKIRPRALADRVRQPLRAAARAGAALYPATDEDRQGR